MLLLLNVKQYPNNVDDKYLDPYTPPTPKLVPPVVLQSMQSIIFTMMLSVLLIRRDDNNRRTIPTMLSLLIRRDGRTAMMLSVSLIRCDNNENNNDTIVEIVLILLSQS